MVAWWRSSLRLRVITTTMLLGTVVAGIIGTALFSQVAEGLVRQAVEANRVDAVQETRNTQELFDSMDQRDDASLNATAYDLIQAIGPVDQPRRALLVRSMSNDRDARITTMASPGLDLGDIPAALAEALDTDPGNQQVLVTDVHLDDFDRPVASVVVGARVDITRAGPHDLYLIYPMTREQATLDLIRQWFSVGGVLLLGLTGAVAWVATSMVARPVGQAARVSQQMAQGHLDERLPVRGRDELDQLAMSFNTMADSIQAQIRQLESLSRLQQRFVSDVSHELRTPLTTIRMAGEVLHASREEFTAPAARSAELLYEELDRFEELLTELLEISRYDSGAVSLEAETEDLGALVRQVLSSLAALARRSGSEFRTVIPDGPVEVEMDTRRVNRILRNLVANALDHAEGKPIDIQVTSGPEAVTVTVRDHGIGLTPAQADRVFDRFWRADPARTRTTGGTGLGLAISHGDARLHGGWLQVNGSPGQGAVFRLTLPREQAHPIAEEPGPVPLDEDRDSHQDTPGDSHSGTPADSRQGASQDSNRGDAVVTPTGPTKEGTP